MINQIQYNPTLVIQPKTYRVEWVSAIQQCLHRHTPDDYHILTGPPAHWLYIALAAHPLHQRPEEAKLMHAYAARAFIERMGDDNLNQPQPGPWSVARRVVMHWGQHIRPWLGIVLFDKQTGQIVELAEYTTLYSLEDGAKLSPSESFQVITYGE